MSPNIQYFHKLYICVYNTHRKIVRKFIHIMQVRREVQFIVFATLLTGFIVVIQLKVSNETSSALSNILANIAKYVGLAIIGWLMWKILKFVYGNDRKDEIEDKAIRSAMLKKMGITAEDINEQIIEQEKKRANTKIDKLL